MSELFKAMKWAAFQEEGGRTFSQEEAEKMSSALVTPIRSVANIADPQGGRKNHPKRRRPSKRGRPKEKPEKPDKGG